MNDIYELISSPRHWLRFVAASAILTGLWFAPTATARAFDSYQPWHPVFALLGWAMLAGGVIAYLFTSAPSPRMSGAARLARTILMTVGAFIITWFPIALLGVNYRLCRPGEQNGPSMASWLVPAAIYYAIGYTGFANSRWLRIALPVAVAAGTIGFLAVEIIWTSGSGCGD